MSHRRDIVVGSHPISLLLLRLLLLLQLLTTSTARLNSNNSNNNNTIISPTSSSSYVSSRIVGGAPVVLGQYSNFALWDQGCAATLILPDIALTAAHCYLGNPGTLTFNMVNRKDRASTAIDFDVDYVRIHPRFNGNRQDPDWDYMILKVKEAVRSSVATPVILNRDPNIPAKAGEVLTSIGFGRLKEGANRDSDTLQAVTLPFVPNVDCAPVYNSGRINEASVCAGSEGRDACQVRKMIACHMPLLCSIMI